MTTGSLSQKKKRQPSFPASGQKCSAIFDSVLWVEGTVVFLSGQPQPKSPLGLCHLEEKNTCSVLPLPMRGDSPPALETGPQAPLGTAVPLF